MRWGFFSCNGFGNAGAEARWGGIQPLWRDVMASHATEPMHVMVGGGDQIYNDGVRNTPAIAQERQGGWQAVA